MIDNFKIRLDSHELTEKYLKTTGNYTQSFWVGKNDDAKNYPLKKKVSNIELKVSAKQSILGNSLHKYYNILEFKESGEHNYNDFSYCNVLLALEKLNQDFRGLDLNRGYLQSLEFGFNLLVNKEPKYYLDNNFLLFEYKAPTINKGTNAMNYRKFEHNNIAWKVYDKKSQYGLNKNIIRIEIVYGSGELKKLGIQTINDVKRRENILLLYSRYLESFKGFTIVDSRFSRKDLSSEFICDLGNRLEPSYWKYKKGKNNINRDKTKLKQMIKESHLNTTEIYFRKLIHDKFTELFYYSDCFQQVA
ncbi:hypothetical protein BAX94_11365 [Elizabethkingia meningoseptica]|uniref:hypothetical protein n=1 Tax=Elizabethkingia meningoseptica TaxID=238 RepID=UPI0008A8481F|nr:hypothetical protein [Elizabethkingia meningoseptica]MDE5448562.1 hypothetical protein [Elizabethkingia meningoseptica]MDE5472526.1 hypothetical protein [Elizabethkingia meningoseptica]MDE5520444.1 hypothetical protein [Elizabethkingia meningoseptica]MDE5523840.1 hypothetical protein [Elizabethkingia meningoseptica]OHT28546.1 hypothetical protein BGC12_12830 [Elizabethkingia meningoseptica]